jgi:CopG family nickel-responsive transcriptional regulator
MEKVTRIGISIEPELLEKFDNLIEKQQYTNRSEAVRDMIRQYLIKEDWDKGIGTVVGSITLTYDYDSSGVVEKLARVEHKHNEIIHCSSLVRLDEKTSMEVITAQGSSFELKELADAIKSIKGIKQTEMVKSSIK